MLGESVADPDDDAPRPVLERFDLRKREVTELAAELDWFAVSGDGARLVIKDGDELRVLPSEHKDDDGSADSVTVDLSRARFPADPVALWRHAYAEAGRLMRRDFWIPGMSGVDWDGVLDAYRPLLDRIRGAADFADLLWEVVGELGTSHAYVGRAGQDFAARARPRSGCWARTCPATRPGAGSWTGCCPANRPTRGPARRWRRPAWSSGPETSWSRWTGSRSTRCAAPGRCWPGRPAQPVELTVRPRGAVPRRSRAPSSVVPLRDERRLRYQDWVAGPAPPGPRAQRRAARLPAHPGHGRRGLGPLPP